MRENPMRYLLLIGWVFLLPATEVQVMDIAPALDSADVRSRIKASAQLRDLGARAEPAMPLLLKGLSDQYWDVRTNAAATLAAIGPTALPGLIESLQTEDYHRNLFAAQALGLMGEPAGSAAGHLGTLLVRRTMTDSATRRWSAWALSRMGAAAEPALEALISCLQDYPDSMAARYAAQALGNIGPAAEPAIAELLERIALCNDSRRALGQIGPAAVAQLLSLAEDETDRRRQWAMIETFGACGPAAAEAVPWLISQAEPGHDRWFVARSAQSLGEIGSAAEAAIPVLARIATGHDYHNARRQACIALGRIAAQDDRARAALQAAAEDDHEAVASAARAALGNSTP